MKMISLSIYLGFWFSLRFLKHLVKLKVGLLHSGEGIYCCALLDNKATFFLKKKTTLLVYTLLILLYVPWIFTLPSTFHGQ